MTSTWSHILDAKESARYHRSLLLRYNGSAILPLLFHFIVVDNFGVWIRHIQYLIESWETGKLIAHHLLEFALATQHLFQEGFGVGYVALIHFVAVFGCEVLHLDVVPREIVSRIANSPFQFLDVDWLSEFVIYWQVPQDWHGRAL